MLSPVIRDDLHLSGCKSVGLDIWPETSAVVRAPYEELPMRSNCGCVMVGRSDVDRNQWRLVRKLDLTNREDGYACLEKASGEAHDALNG